jgi:hypothetical protein
MLLVTYLVGFSERCCRKSKIKKNKLQVEYEYQGFAQTMKMYGG